MDIQDAEVLENNSPEVGEEVSKSDSKVFIPEVDSPEERYRYADTLITCAVCGKDTKIEHPEFKNVEVGINLPPLYTTNKHFLGLACSHCQAALTLRMVEAEFPPAYDISHAGKYDLESKTDITWTAGKSNAEFTILLAEGDDFKEVGLSTEPKFTLELAESTTYQLRIDTKYEAEDGIVTGNSVLVSTNSAPVTAEEVTEDTKQAE